MYVISWLALFAVQLQICILFPFAVEPFVTSKHLLPKIWSTEPVYVHCCVVAPVQGWRVTAAPFVFDAAARHLVAMEPGWTACPVGVGPAVVVVVVLELTEVGRLWKCWQLEDDAAGWGGGVDDCPWWNVDVP